jgi:HEAT repeat protein
MTRAQGIVAVLVAAVIAGPAAAQSLDRRVASAPDGSVQFHFAARAGVCGNGKNFMRADDSNWYTSYNGDGYGRDMCADGPVRVVITRAGRDVVKIETFAGPLATDESGGKDIGAAPAREAAAYLLGLATSLDGRPAREALTPAMLADSAVVTPQLLQLAKDQGRARDLRRSAISWLARRRTEAGGVGADAVERALDQMVRDRSESESVRSQALSTISGLDRGEGIPVLIKFAADADTWLSRQAFSTLSRSGDPRAREYIRNAVKRSDLTEENKVSAIQSLGGEYANGADLKALRDMYPSLNTDRQRDAVISTLASAGGTENGSWLIAIAKSSTEPPQRRRRAISLLAKFDDPRVRDALKELIDK